MFGVGGFLGNEVAKQRAETKGEEALALDFL